MEYLDKPAGWFGTVDEFIAESNSRIRDDLRGFVSALTLPVEDPQLRAWAESVQLLKQECQLLVLEHPESRSWGLIFEYELPRERGRRPDLVVLTGCSMNVVEFKGRHYAEQVDLDQVAAYGRDLAEYHGGSRGLNLNLILSLNGTFTPPQRVENVWIVGGKRLGKCLSALADVPPCDPPDLQQWVRSDYSPLPSLVSAARRIFAHEPLPQIRRAFSAGIPEALASLQNAATTAKEHHERHISLVTGVPGAGKTLVGLQFVYETRFTGEEGERPAIFLSGNGPLVNVLQHALKSRVFVQDVHGFLVRYGGTAKRLPEEHIWVYDEAQRAWDSERVKSKRGHDLSEHEDFLNLGMRMPDWSVLVGLIGQGQEIHIGEEGGLRLWDQAITKSGGKWIIHCPARIASLFEKHQVVVDDALDLSASLRSHVASSLHEWVASLLEGRLDEANKLSLAIHEANFRIYVTRDLEEAKWYVRQRYSDNPEGRFGLIASSKAKKLPLYGMNASWAASRSFRAGPWYNDDPNSVRSCCQLLDVATEFQCQGLELDFPIVGWDMDLWWNGVRWESKPGRGAAKDPHQLRINSYRVLLTRGRDGMIIVVPPHIDFEATYCALLQGGCIDLQRFVAIHE